MPAVQEHSLSVLLNAEIALREHGPATLLTLRAHPAMLVSSPLHAQTAAPIVLLELPIPYQVSLLAPIVPRTPTPMPMLLDYKLARLALMGRSSLLLKLKDATNALQVLIKMATFVPIVLQEHTLVMVLTHALPALLALIAAVKQARLPPHVAQARIPTAVPPRALIASLAATLRMVVQMHAVYVLQAKREIREPTPKVLMLAVHATQDSTHSMTALLTALSVKMDMCQLRAKRHAPHVPPVLTHQIIIV